LVGSVMGSRPQPAEEIPCAGPGRQHVSTEGGGTEAIRQAGNRGLNFAVEADIRSYWYADDDVKAVIADLNPAVRDSSLSRMQETCTHGLKGGYMATGQR
jgi:hypothetical protein